MRPPENSSQIYAYANETYQQTLMIRLNTKIDAASCDRTCNPGRKLALQFLVSAASGNLDLSATGNTRKDDIDMLHITSTV